MSVTAPAFAKLVLSGQIEAEEVHIGTPAPLRVTSVNVSEGDRVTAGQTLMVLDNSELQAKSQGVKLSLAALTNERDRLRKSINQLSSRLAFATKQQHLSVSGSVRTKAGASTRTVSASESTASAGESTKGAKSAGTSTKPPTLTTALVGGQAQALDEEMQVQVTELQNAQAEQSKMLANSTRLTAEAAEKAYTAQKAALHEVEKAKLEAASKHGWFGFLLPKKLKNAKGEAIKEVISAKEQALDQAYAIQQQSMKKVCDAQQQAMQEAFDAKRQALEQSYKAKRAALQQVATAMQAMQATAAEQQKQVAAQLSAFQSEMTGAMGGAQPSLASALSASQAGILTLQLESARTRLLAVESAIAQAQAGQLEVQAKAKMLKVNSPITGVCSTRNINVGELPIPGQTLITILNPEKMYLHAFVPEDLLGGVRIGQKAKVKIDFQGAPLFDATVTKIDQQASFTPENVSLPEDRVRQVFGIKLQLHGAANYAKPGMPAEAYIEPQ